MISKISGLLIKKQEKNIEIMTSAGIGFEIFVPKVELFLIDQLYTLFISMQFSSEKGYTLYGFFDEITKIYFLQLQECHGIGPKLALTILSHLTLLDLYKGIITENKSLFDSMSGIGKKKAELIILELKSKIKLLPIPQEISGENKNIFINKELLNDLESALLKIGFHKNETKKMLEKVLLDKNINNYSFSELITVALNETT